MKLCTAMVSSTFSPRSQETEVDFCEFQINQGYMVRRTFSRKQKAGASKIAQKLKALAALKNCRTQGGGGNF